MIDDDRNLNVVRYGSETCKGIEGSIMAAENQELTVGFDNAFVVNDLMEKKKGKKDQVRG